MKHGRDLYEVLGVAPTATLGEIKVAYRRLAKTHHPDVSTDPAATETFKEISVAYSVLSSDSERARYDADRTRGASATATHGQSPGERFDQWQREWERLMDEEFGPGWRQYADLSPNRARRFRDRSFRVRRRRRSRVRRYRSRHYRVRRFRYRRYKPLRYRSYRYRGGGLLGDLAFNVNYYVGELSFNARYLAGEAWFNLTYTASNLRDEVAWWVSELWSSFTWWLRDIFPM